MFTLSLSVVGILQYFHCSPVSSTPQQPLNLLFMLPIPTVLGTTYCCVISSRDSDLPGPIHGQGWFQHFGYHHKNPRI